MSEPRITVLIPTRERRDVLEKSLHTVMAQDYENLNILVSDNFSSDGTGEFVRSLPDKRIKYINTGRRVSMSHNWEFALSHVEGGWVTIIGDDDGLLPSSLRRVSSIVQETKASAIRSSVCSYQWPSLTGRGFGQLVVPLGDGYEMRDAKLWLARVMNGYADYPQLPMLYNGGFVSVDVLNEIKRRTGAIYRSCIPDVYSAISVASVIGEYVYSKEPLAINGASRHSTGTSQFSSSYRAESSPSGIFVAEGNIPFHNDLPLCADRTYPASLHALVLESYLQSSNLRTSVSQDMFSEQLAVILATCGRHEEAVNEWGKEFALRHRLDFDHIARRARTKKRTLKVRLMASRLSAEMNRVKLGSADLQLRDVYEASIVAAAVRRMSPSRLPNLVGIAMRALKKALGP